jgi:hypothetical protein
MEEQPKIVIPRHLSEGLNIGHSSAVRLRQIKIWRNNQRSGYLGTSPRDFYNRPLKRRSARYYLSLSARDDAGINKWDTQTAFALLKHTKLFTFNAMRVPLLVSFYLKLNNMFKYY